MAKQRSKRIYMKGTPNPKNIKLYEQYKRAKLISGKSPKTLESYDSDFMQFFKYLNYHCDNILLEDITEIQIEDYIGYCMEEGNNEKRLNRRISSVSSFLKYLKLKRIIKDNWCDWIERPGQGEYVQKRIFLTEEQLKELRQKLSEQKDLQLETYINFGLSTMARSNAISQVKWENINFETRWVTEIVEKGRKEKDLRFDNRTKELLLRLKNEREEKGVDYPYVFMTNYHGKHYGQVKSRVLGDRVKKAFRMIGITEGGCNHDLRHSMSNILQDRGMPIETISKLLGHEGLDVTIKHYTIENLDKLAEEFDNYMD